jgi:hypothetical protein
LQVLVVEVDVAKHRVNVRLLEKNSVTVVAGIVLAGRSVGIFAGASPCFDGVFVRSAEGFCGWVELAWIEPGSVVRALARSQSEDKEERRASARAPAAIRR